MLLSCWSLTCLVTQGWFTPGVAEVPRPTGSTFTKRVIVRTSSMCLSTSLTNLDVSVVKVPVALQLILTTGL